MPRRGLRYITAVLSCAMAVGCAQETPLETNDPAAPPSADMLRAAVRVHVDLVRGTAVVSSADARAPVAPGLSLALLGSAELKADVSNVQRSAVGEFAKKKVRVRLDVTLTNLLPNTSFGVPSFPTPPAANGALLLFPFASVVTSGSGKVAPSADWDGATFNFFNDDNCASTYQTDCYRWEPYPAPLGGGQSTAVRTVGFDVDPTVLEFDTYFVLAADLSNKGAVAGRFTFANSPSGTQFPVANATVTLDLFQPDGTSAGQLTTTTDADGYYLIPSVPPSPPGADPSDNTAYNLTVAGNVCGAPHDIDTSGATVVEIGRTTVINFLQICDS